MTAMMRIGDPMSSGSVLNSFINYLKSPERITNHQESEICRVTVRDSPSQFTSGDSYSMLNNNVVDLDL